MIDKCLENDPAARWQTVEELKAALEGLGGGAHAKTRRPKGWKSLLWVIGASAVVAAAVVSVRAVQSRNARIATERAAMEQAAALDAAQKAKVAELKAAAEAALASGDLETAGAKIAELDRAGGPTSVSAELRKRYESKAGERETNKRYAAASVAREAAQKLDQGQGFGEKLKALEVTWREAEAARQGQGWGQALSGYDAVLAACKALEGEEVSRQDAKTRREEAEKAKAAVDQANSVSDAKDLYAAGGRASSRAAELFGKGSFADASKVWKEASATYAAAKVRALAVQAYSKAKSAFESELGGRGSARAALLGSHGGEKWAEVKRLQKLGEASANDPAAGEKAYKEALAVLPGAIEEAQTAEHAAKLTAALTSARQAKAAGEWQVCLDKAGEALALETGGRASPRAAVVDESTALKREAEGNLTPTLTVECEVAGARVSDGGVTFGVPHTFALKAGGSYSFTVSCASGDAAPELQRRGHLRIALAAARLCRTVTDVETDVK